MREFSNKKKFYKENVERDKTRKEEREAADYDFLVVIVSYRVEFLFSKLAREAKKKEKCRDKDIRGRQIQKDSSWDCQRGKS